MYILLLVSEGINKYFLSCTCMTSAQLSTAYHVVSTRTLNSNRSVFVIFCLLSHEKRKCGNEKLPNEIADTSLQYA
jgi:hypothetical protein